MLKKQDIENYQHHFDVHKDYFVLMEEYSETEMFKEIVHFMNMAFPEWLTNRGIGGWAAEFILTNIQDLDYFQKQKNYSSLKKLTDCYLCVSTAYHTTKTQYSVVANELLLQAFNHKFEIELSDKEYLSPKEFDIFHESLYTQYQDTFLNKICYNFDEFELPYL